MKKILILLLLTVGLHAAINECVSDVYFGNGIDTDDRETDKAMRNLKEQFLTKYPTQANLVNEWKVSYNHTHGMGVDIYESMLQKVFEDFNKGGLAPFVSLALDSIDYSLKGILKWLGKKPLKKPQKNMQNN